MVRQGLATEVDDYFFGIRPPAASASIRQVADDTDLQPYLFALEDKISVIFAPARYRSRFGDSRFMEQRFMVDVFVCVFQVRGEVWDLSGNLCYAEQDNPFTPPYG